MTPRTHAAAMLSALLFFTIAIYFLLEGPRLASLASSAQATTISDTPAGPPPFEVVARQLTDEHRALEAAQLAMADEPHLKTLYLDCARATSGIRMDIDEAVYCQSVADALMHRHFGGSFERLIDWWRQQPVAPSGTATSADRV